MTAGKLKVINRRVAAVAVVVTVAFAVYRLATRAEPKYWVGLAGVAVVWGVLALILEAVFDMDDRWAAADRAEMDAYDYHYARISEFTASTELTDAEIHRWLDGGSEDPRPERRPEARPELRAAPTPLRPLRAFPPPRPRHNEPRRGLTQEEIQRLLHRGPPAAPLRGPDSPPDAG